MAYKIKGRVLKIGKRETIKEGFEKQDLVITTFRFDPYTGEPGEDTENTPKLTFAGARCTDLDGLKEGDVVTVSFDIRGRAYTRDNRLDYFTEVRPLRVERERKTEPANFLAGKEPEGNPFMAPEPTEASAGIKDQNDDLPF